MVFSSWKSSSGCLDVLDSSYPCLLSKLLPLETIGSVDKCKIRICGLITVTNSKLIAAGLKNGIPYSGKVHGFSSLMTYFI